MSAHFRDLWQALDGEPAAQAPQTVGADVLPSLYQVSALAAASVGAAGTALSQLIQATTGHAPAVRVDQRLASLWFSSSIVPQGWAVPPLWDPVAGDYRTSDGWIRLHTNAPHHRRAAETVLGAQTSRATMAAAVARWPAQALEAAVVAAGGCAAQMRAAAEWAIHPAGAAVNAEPLIAHEAITPAQPVRCWRGDAARPLRGVRVLDLTRVLAGPVATRFLAGFGADVLRLDPASWNEPGVEPDMTVGKRCARLDLASAAGRERFAALLETADVLVHGYRSTALPALGFSAGMRRRLNPGLVDVALDAYGFAGPWAGRRGFDSLVQMSCGIAEAGMRWKGADTPVPLPCQALDHATGYLMAAAALCGLRRRATSGAGTLARLSLARTAATLQGWGAQHDCAPFAPLDAADIGPDVEATHWGPARRLRAPLTVAGADMRWDIPARPLGWAEPVWAGERVAP